MAKRKLSRSWRVTRLAKKLADHWTRLREKSGRGQKPLARHSRQSRVRRMIAYDLETTRIKPGVPDPLYLTAFCEDWQVSVPIQSIDHLGDLLEHRFLTEENNRVRFIAWNGNKFDAYLIGLALLKREQYELRPYLTSSKNLRGIKVSLKDTKLSWEFLDGISMTLGNAGSKEQEGEPFTLKEFLAVFASDRGKLESPNWEREEFDPKNKKHVEYAERDSEGLYWGMKRAQAIVMENFGVPLQPTIGNTAIRIFQAEMPEDVQCWSPTVKVSKIIRSRVMRGGYCHLMRKYHGPVWKYDINQAYAAAMRDAWLPGGRCYRVKAPSRFASCSIYRIKATAPKGNTIPFLYVNDQGKNDFGVDEIGDTWVTSSEYEQLKREGWRIEFLEGYAWEDAFNMRSYVDKLERLRMGAADGPSGPLGTMIKSIGNNSYGKTVEQLGGMELVLAAKRPEGFHHYQTDEDEIQCIWFRFKEPLFREYHQPQIGAFITAHVRVEVRRAALLAPESFLYADTDCVVFDAPVELPIDPKRYGYWKIEEAGERYYMIDKKVYASEDGETKKAKGMNIRWLDREQFRAWFDGAVPIQKQVQRNAWVAVMAGGSMFVERERRGSKGLQKMLDTS